MITTTQEILYVLIFLVMFALLGYITYAAVYKKCPFKPKPKDNPSKLTSVEYDDSQSPSIGVILIFVLVIGLMIVMIYFSIKLSMKRYEIAGDAIKHGHTGVAAAALAPEIGEGIGDAIGGITGSNRYNN
jgi:hypothetical protein